jgi:hypothetical protein
MHKEYRWDNLGEITVKTWDFKVKTYPNIEAAARDLYFGYYQWSRDDIKLGYLRYCSKNPEFRHIGLTTAGDTKIFLTCEGVVVPPWKVMEVYKNLPWVDKPSWRYGNYEYRAGPVPGIHCWKAGRYRGYRAPKTTQERREHDFIDKYDDDCIEYGVKIRAKRNLRNVPNRWDDIRVSHGYYSKNWKKYRSHQWKAHK